MTEILITSSVMIAVILLLRWLFRGKVSQRLIYGAWLLVAIRLLIPVQFGQLHFSVLTTAKPVTEAMTQLSDQQIAGITEQDAYQQVLKDYVENDPEVFTPEVHDHIQSAIDSNVPSDEIAVMIDKVYPNQDVFIPEVQEDVQQLVTQTAAPITLGQIAGVIWILGIVVMAIWFTVVNLRHSAALRNGAEKLDCASPIPIPVYVTNKANSPCLVGLFKPVIYLTPESIVAPESLRHILTHELTHYAHKDHLWALVRCVCLCVYWFHPLVWVAAYLSRRDCEMACDEGALKQLGEEHRLAYGRTLLAVVAQSHSPGKLLQTATSMSETKKQLKQRLSFIARKSKLSVIATICMVLVCAIAVGSVTAGAQKNTPSDTTSSAPTEETSSEPTEEVPSKPNSWDVSEELKLQFKQEYLQYMDQYPCECTMEDVQLAVVSHMEDGYAMLIGCKCSSIDLNASWNDLQANGINDLTFYMPKGWYIQLYKDGTFRLLDAAFNLQRVTPEQISTIWTDYYNQFPTAKEYYMQRHPVGSPNAAEMRMLSQYCDIVQFLEEYDITLPQSNSLQASGINYTSHYGIRYCYEKLLEMDEVDPWIDYCKEHYSNNYAWDRQFYLNKFSVIEDVKLSATQYDHYSDTQILKNNTHWWYYDSKSRLNYEQVNQQDDFSMQLYIPRVFQSGDDYYIQYDNTGRIEKILGQHGYYTYTPNYDTSGRITSMTVQDGNKIRTIQYTYDGAGHLIRTEMFGSIIASGNYLIEYTYDTDGNLIRKVETFYNGSTNSAYEPEVYIRCKEITEYHYNADGILKKASFTEQFFDDFFGQYALKYQTQDEYTFSYDQQGRLARYDIVYGDKYIMSGDEKGQLKWDNPVESGYVVITYGDFIYYEP